MRRAGEQGDRQHRRRAKRSARAPGGGGGRRAVIAWLAAAMMATGVLAGAPEWAEAQSAAGAGSGGDGVETGDNPEAQKLDKVDFEQKLGNRVPRDLKFEDERGNSVSLSRYFQKERPVIVVMGYFECPMLCNLVRKGLIDTLAEIDLELGRDYSVVSVSVDPSEGEKLARAKSEKMLDRFRDKKAQTPSRKVAASGMHNLTGDREAIDRLADAIGFQYRYDREKQQYLHPSGFVVAAPDGRVSKYYFGVDYRARDVRLGLVDAAEGEVGNAIDQVLLRCYQYDPKTGSYSFAIMRLLRVLALLTAGLLAFSIWSACRDSGRLNKAMKPEPPGSGPRAEVDDPSHPSEEDS